MTPIDNAGNAFTALSGHEVLAIEGQDAASFLQAQLASDVSTLAPGDWQWSSWLSAQGRVLALLLLLRSGPDAFHAVVSHGRGTELAARLQRFVLRARVGIERPALHASGCIATGAGGTGPVHSGGVATRAGTCWELALGGAGARRLRIGEDAGLSDPAAAWALADIHDGVPWIAVAVSDQETPQALGLERLAAFSLHKGCYPGQEIVARTHFLGRSKRRLSRFHVRGDWMPAPGTLLADAKGATSAMVVAMARDGPATTGLAVVRGEAAHGIVGPSGEALAFAKLS